MQNYTMPYRLCFLQNSLSLIFVLLFMVSEVSSAETAKSSYLVPEPRPSNVTMSFCEAIQHNNLEIVKLLSQQDPDVNGPNCGGLTPLSNAARASGDTSAILNFLLYHGADPNYQTGTWAEDEAGKTALMYSVDSDIGDFDDLSTNLHKVTILLKHGTDVNLEDFNGYTALDYIVVTGIDLDYLMPQVAKKKTENTKKIIQMLVAHHADVNHKNKSGVSRWGKKYGGMTPLMLASRQCDADIVKLLVSLGADASLKTQTGDTAFSLALASAANTTGKVCTATIHVLQRVSY